jgi:23S rRNA pseudouridine1911/1915/1917 synthase
MNSLSIEILFESDDVLVINKPVGLLVHADGVSEEPTLVDWFLERTPSARGVGEPGKAKDGQLLERSGVVHRLDRETSGVLILAKTQVAHIHLKTQFHDRLAKKEYRAIVYGRMRERWGTIDKKIGRSPSDHRQRSAMPGARGVLREAVTDWECIGQAQIDSEHFSYLKLRPKTGRTHQLRVHLRAIDRPIVGDVLYAEPWLKVSHNLGLSRMALHAHTLELELPSGTRERFIAPVPNELELAVERITEE